MRKITSLLMLLCMFVGTAWGQVQITNIESLTGEEELTFSTSGRGGWAVKVDGTQFGSTNDYGFGTTVDYRNDQHVFQLKENEGSLYLFSVHAQKYVNPDRSLSETATNALTYVEQGDGTFVFKFSDDKIINIGGDNQIAINNWGSGAYQGSADKEYDVGNKITIMDVTEARLVKVVDVTYNYYINEKFYTSQVETQEINSEVEVPAQAFLTVVDYQGTIGEEDCEITVNCTENLPFVVTADLNAPVWQVVEMHRNNTFRVWDYVENDVDVKVTEMSSNKEGVSDDSKLWCFTGNLIDGFKIYNKKAGTSVTLNATSGTVKVGTAAGGNDVWKLKKSTVTNDPAACFTHDGSTYMNQNGGIIKYHNQPDNGSTNYFYAPADIVLQEASLLNNIPAGAVGALIDEELVFNIREAAEDAIANPTDIEKVQTLSILISQSRESEKVEMTAGYYFVKGTGNGNTASWYMTHRINSGKECLWAADAPASGLTADYVWKFETADGGYKMQCTNLNAYFNIKTATNDGDNNTYLTETAGDAKKLKLEDKGLAKYVIKDTESKVIRSEDGGQLNYWSGEGNETWYIIPATELEITFGEAGYATTYLPFDVTLPNTVKAYAVNDIEGEYAKMEEKTDIPAENAAILEGKGTQTLTIANATSVWTGNKLEGTFVNTYVGKGAYVLAMPTIDEVAQPVGFYKATLNKNADGETGTTHFLNNANKAYLPASAVTGNARFISFDFGTETAIDELKGENGNVKTVIYDLSGRRVQKAQKGLYIVNGVKVIK